MEEVFTLPKLYDAYLDCRKMKRNTLNALSFDWELEKNLSFLLEELVSRKYSIGRSLCFVVEKPVIREIFAGEFRDRIIHHLFVREIECLGEAQFIYDSFACRKGKGTHNAVKKLQKYTRSITHNNTREAWYAQIDISGFFMAIDHSILYNLLEKIVFSANKSMQWKSDVLFLGKKIIFSSPKENYIKKGNLSLFDLVPEKKSLFHSRTGTGLPIGNYSSQFFANVYLNELDQFIKRNIRCKRYIRYVDDAILLERDKSVLIENVSLIDTFLQKNLFLSLHPKKKKFQRVNSGIDFLGYITRPHYILARRRVVSNCKDALY
ncbi:MAG: hypothetical protein EOM19_07690, partial [Candidatus Moranbacteria bacterium]|nr:hypothetical protein [Candidatus Moranbacteria bacterium]